MKFRFRKYVAAFLFLMLVVCVAPPLWAQGASDEAVKTWTADAIKQAMTFDFSNMEEKKEGAKDIFTAKGHEEFYKALEKSRIPDIVREKQQIVRLNMVCVPEITKTEADETGGKIWVLEVPVEIQYQSETEARNDYHEVLVIVKEDEVDGHARGLGIVQWIALPMNPMREHLYFVCTKRERFQVEIEQLTAEMEYAQKRLKSLKAKMGKLEDEIPF